MQTSTQLNLSQFTGSMDFAKFGLTSSIMSEGVTHVATEMESFWLVQDIDLYVRELRKEGKDTGFIVAKLVPNDEGADLILEDGNDNILKTINVPFTDFDFDRVNGEFQLWVAPNEFGEFTLYLPSEH
jgi:hypothetical protein